MNGGEARKLYDRLAAWSATACERLVDDFWPDMPSGVEDRDADVWEALLAVADLAGERWAKAARVSAVTLVTAARCRPPSIGVLLLRDVKKVFDAHRGTDKLPTEDIISDLVDMDEAPWATIRKGEPIDARSLAARLRKYGVSSKLHRIGDAVFKGYSCAQFEDAWKRYVTPVQGDLSVTSVTEGIDGARVTDVTDSKGPMGAERDAGLFEYAAHNGNAVDERCACGNTLQTPDAINSGKCKPCRDKLMAGDDR